MIKHYFPSLSQRRSAVPSLPREPKVSLLQSALLLRLRKPTFDHTRVVFRFYEIERVLDAVVTSSDQDGLDALMRCVNRGLAKLQLAVGVLGHPTHRPHGAAILELN